MAENSNATEAGQCPAEQGKEIKKEEPKKEEICEKANGADPVKQEVTEGSSEEKPVKQEASESSKQADPNICPELEQKIIRQVEYYFGDINLQKDKFLLEEIKKDDGWVSLETMVKFNRLKTLSDDHTVIVEALRKSTTGLMEIHEDCSKIRRCPSKPVPEFTADRKHDLKSRSVYAKGIPLDATLDDVQTFMDQYGQTEHILMRKNEQRNFKGSVFVLFQTKDVAEKFLKEEGTKYKDEELIKMLKDDYFKSKTDEKKKKKEEDHVRKEDAKKEREDEEKQRLLDRITKGAILHLTGLPGGLEREDLKKIFGEHCNVAWVDFNKGDTSAKLRFDEEGGAGKTLEKIKEANAGVIKIKDTDVTGTVLEGDDELEHWRDIFQSQRKQRDQRSKKRTHGHRGGRRGGPPSKRSKTDGGYDDDE